MWPPFLRAGMTNSLGRRVTATLLLLLACLFVIVIYRPALSGGLNVDDYFNLRPLEIIKSRGYAAYVFSGVSGLTGRPLALLSFALQYGSWPDNLAALKTVNLVLHIVIGLLVLLVFGTAARSPGVDSGAFFFVPAGTAVLWMLHPMHVSTVLYIIQRMTQLSSLFVLLGAWGYLRGRRLCADNARGGYALMSLSVVLGTVLAILCKENGALLPLLILVTDITLLRDWPAPRGYARWRMLFLALPSVLIGSYLLQVALHGDAGFGGRPYSMYQKTLTEAAVLIQYLNDLVLPHPGAYGLYHDDFPISRGLLDPPWTLAAVSAIVGLIGTGLLLRRRAAPLAFGLLWFFSGHIIESTHLNLAIYFEHRNYLPSIGICYLLAWACAAAARHFSRREVIAAAAALYIALLGWSSFATAALWRDPMRMALEGVLAHPNSPSALAALENRYLAEGETGNALRLYRDMEARFPAEIYPLLKQTVVEACVRNARTPDDRWTGMLDKARQAGPPAFAILGELDTVISAVISGECRALDQSSLLQLMETLAQNPAYRRERGGLLQLAANLRMERLEFDQAHADLVAAVRASPTLERQKQLLGLQIAMKRVTEAEQSLDALERSLDARPLTHLAYDEDLRRFRERLQALRRGD